MPLRLTCFPFEATVADRSKATRQPLPTRCASGGFGISASRATLSFIRPREARRSATPPCGTPRVHRHLTERRIRGGYRNPAAGNHLRGCLVVGYSVLGEVHPPTFSGVKSSARTLRVLAALFDGGYDGGNCWDFAILTKRRNMESEWYTREAAGKVEGPLSAEILKSRTQAGIIKPDTFVRKGRGPWIEATKVRGLFPISWNVHRHKPPCQSGPRCSPNKAK